MKNCQTVVENDPDTHAFEVWLATNLMKIQHMLICRFAFKKKELLNYKAQSDYDNNSFELPISDDFTATDVYGIRADGLKLGISLSQLSRTN